MREQITMSFKDVLDATHLSHIDLIQGLREELKNHSQKPDTNNFMATLIMLVGLDYLKQSNQITNNSTPNEVSDKLIKLIHGQEPEWSVYLNKDILLPIITNISEKGMPAKETGHKILERFFKEVCHNKHKNPAEADCTNMFKHSTNLALIMNHIKDKIIHPKEEQSDTQRAIRAGAYKADTTGSTTASSSSSRTPHSPRSGT